MRADVPDDDVMMAATPAAPPILLLLGDGSTKIKSVTGKGVASREGTTSDFPARLFEHVHMEKRRTESDRIRLWNDIWF